MRSPGTPSSANSVVTPSTIDFMPQTKATVLAGVIAGAHSTTSSGVFGDRSIEATVESSTAFADSALSEALGETG